MTVWYYICFSAILPNHPTLSLSHRVQKTVLYICVSFAVSHTVSQFFASGGQSIGVSASASVRLLNIQDWLPLGWTGWVSLQSKELSRAFSNTTLQKHQFFSAQLSLQSNSPIHIWETTGKTIALTRWTFVEKVMSLLFNMLSRSSERYGIKS